MTYIQLHILVQWLEYHKIHNITYLHVCMYVPVIALLSVQGVQFWLSVLNIINTYLFTYKVAIPGFNCDVV